MKELFKWSIIIITTFIFLNGFVASYNAESIDHLDYVIVIGVDTIENSDNFEYSFEFANISSFSENASSEDDKPIINKVSAPSISGAINIMNSYVGKQINLSHCKVIVFSEEIAKKGLLPEVSALINNTQIRPSANVLITEGKASDYIQNSTSSLERVLTKYFDSFPNSSEYTGYTSNIILGNFYTNIVNKNIGATAILGRLVKTSNQEPSSGSSESSSSQSNSGGSESSSNSSSQDSQSDIQNKNNEQSQNEDDNQTPNQDKTENESGHDNPTKATSQDESILEGDRGTENIGLCVFKDDKDVGNLTAMETLCFSIIRNDVEDFFARVDSPFEEDKKIDLAIVTLSSTKIQVDTKHENPIINIKLNITGETLNGLDVLDYSKTETLNRINESLKNYLSTEMLNYLNKTSKELKVDINEFYKPAQKNFLTLSDFDNYNWPEKYQNAEFKIEINSSIMSSNLIQNS